MLDANAAATKRCTDDAGSHGAVAVALKAAPSLRCCCFAAVAAVGGTAHRTGNATLLHDLSGPLCHPALLWVGFRAEARIAASVQREEIRSGWRGVDISRVCYVCRKQHIDTISGRWVVHETWPTCNSSSFFALTRSQLSLSTALQRVQSVIDSDRYLIKLAVLQCSN